MSSLTNDPFVYERHVAGVVYLGMFRIILVRMRGQWDVAKYIAVDAGVMPVNGRDRHCVRGRLTARSVHQEAVNAGTGLSAGGQWHLLDSGNNAFVLALVQIEVDMTRPSKAELPSQRP